MSALRGSSSQIQNWLRGMADVEMHGRFFAAPSPDLILDGIEAADGGKGVILLYNNYAGDQGYAVLQQRLLNPLMR